MNPLLTFAPVAALVAFWREFQTFINRIFAYLVVTATLSTDLADFFTLSCWRNMKQSRYGTRKFSCWGVRIKDQYRLVGIEEAGESGTFWNGWLPLFWRVTDGGERTPKKVQVRYLRGTMDIESLITRALEEENHRRHGDPAHGRFRILRYYGEAGRLPSQHSNSTAPAQGSSDDSPATMQFAAGARPLPPHTMADFGFARRLKPFDDLYFPNEVTRLRELLLEWHTLADWYRERGLAWRFSACLTGPPGTGKTSFVRAFAQELDLPICVLDLSTMSNRDLSDTWRKVAHHSPCVVLIEDADRLIDDEGKFLPALREFGPLTLDAVLNALNGIDDTDGLLTILTANDISRLPEALRRPGRVDVVTHFDLLDDIARLQLATRVLQGEFTDDEIHAFAVNETGAVSGAAFQKMCEAKVLTRKWGRL